MKTTIKIAISATLLILACSQVYAQRAYNRPFGSKPSHNDHEYAYDTSIDLQLGYAAIPYTIHGDVCNSTVNTNGVVFNARLTNFPWKHLGAFAQIGLSSTSTNEIRYFGAMNKADGGRYKYDKSWNNFKHFEYLPILIGGPVWRVDSDDLSLRFRAGFGCSWFYLDGDEYIKYDVNGSDAHYFYEDIAARSASYMMGKNYYETRTIAKFTISPSIQAVFSVSPHFYLSAEIGANILPAQQAFITTICGSFPDEVSTYQNELIKDYSDSVDKIENRNTPDMFYASVGLGWEIGWNRNQRRHTPFFSASR